MFPKDTKTVNGSVLLPDPGGSQYATLFSTSSPYTILRAEVSTNGTGKSGPTTITHTVNMSCGSLSANYGNSFLLLTYVRGAVGTAIDPVFAIRSNQFLGSLDCSQDLRLTTDGAANPQTYVYSVTYLPYKLASSSPLAVRDVSSAFGIAILVTFAFFMFWAFLFNSFDKKYK